MGYVKLNPVDGLYLESNASDGSEAMSTGCAALYDGNKTITASPTNDWWHYHFAYGLDLGSVKTFNRLIGYDTFNSNGWYSAAHDSISIFKSDDNITWTFVERFDGPTRIGGAWTMDLAASITARYIKFFECEVSSMLADTIGASLKVTELEAYVLQLAVLTGTVKEAGVAVQRTVRCFIRSTAELYDTVVSEADGSFELAAPDDTTDMFVVAFDDDAGNQYNAIIYDRVKGAVP